MFSVLKGKKQLGDAGLIWAGSVINSMMPLLMGAAATGIYSHGIELSTALNAPYVIIPVVIASKLMRATKQGAKRCK